MSKSTSSIKKSTLSLRNDNSLNGTLAQKVISSEHLKTDDVLFGRGKRSNNHFGNVFFRELVLSMSLEYKSCSKIQKTALANSIVDRIHKKGGKFLTLIPASDSWVEVKGLALRKKASQALRDSNVYRANHD